MKRYHWSAPLCGVVFPILVVVSGIVAGEDLDPTKKSAAEIVNYYKDNDSKVVASALIAAVAMILLVYFGAWFRQVLRQAAGPDSLLPTAALSGLVVLAAGAAVDLSIDLTLGDLADKLDPSAVSALNALSYDYFIPFVVGMFVFISASGIAILKHRALPKAFGWVAIVLAVLQLAGPIGFFAFLASLVWILVVSVCGLLGRVPAAA